MRTITNLSGLPGPMFNALKSDTYVGGGDISITRLISPPRITALRKAHEDQIIEDASSRIWSLLGSSVHRMLELSADEDVTVEKRLSMEIGGWTLTGQPDLYISESKTIVDYKITSVWSVLFGEKPEWEAQINMQAMLHRNKGDKVNQGYIVAVLRDWQIRRSRYEKDYPSTAVQKISIPLWSQEECLKYAEHRISLHRAAQEEYELNKNVKKLPICSEEERWYRGAHWKAKRMNISTGKINKKADRKCNSQKEAEAFMARAPLPKGTKWAPIEHVPGENIRCSDYCDVANFCDFYKEHVANQQPQDLFSKDTEE